MEETRFLCDLPWKHLSVHPHGVCSVCCVANHAMGNQQHQIFYQMVDMKK